MDRAALTKEIQKLKKEKDICILAHTYQSPEILEVADITGDSYALSVAATKVANQTVVMCGVKFMAETVKMLSPEKTVILSHKQATCPMAIQMDPKVIAEYKAKHPNQTIVAYINTTSELKAVCDVCVTSSSAVRIVEKLAADEILFIPDQNLGAYVRDQVKGKTVHLMDGCCPIHHQVTEDDVLKAKAKYPAAKLAMHPECRPEALRHADMIGSTSAIINYALKTPGEILVGTERGVVDALRINHPDRVFHQLCKDKLVCPNMKKTTLQSVYDAMTGTGGLVIEMDETLRLNAKKPIDNMLLYGEA